jgi:hypothetical protein
MPQEIHFPFERRSGVDRRKAYRLGYFLEGGIERRSGNERRHQHENHWFHFREHLTSQREEERQWVPPRRMARMTFHKRCPSCGSLVRTRIRRSLMMHLIPRSRKYECRLCRLRYLYVCGLSFPITDPVSNRRSSEFYQRTPPLFGIRTRLLTLAGRFSHPLPGQVLGSRLLTPHLSATESLTAHHILCHPECIDRRRLDDM